MLHIQTILVPIDFSDASDHAWKVAQSLARDHQAKLVLMTASPPPPPATEVNIPASDYAGITEESRRRLTPIANAVTEFPVETHVLMGDAGPTIIAVANQTNADLIVMGTHGRRGLSRLLMGSVAEYVLRHAACPVLTIKPTAAEHLSHEEPTSLATRPAITR